MCQYHLLYHCEVHSPDEPEEIQRIFLKDSAFVTRSYLNIYINYFPLQNTFHKCKRQNSKGPVRLK